MEFFYLKLMEIDPSIFTKSIKNDLHLALLKKKFQEILKLDGKKLIFFPSLDGKKLNFFPSNFKPQFFFKKREMKIVFY